MSTALAKKEQANSLLFGVQYLRGFAVLMVVLVHANGIMGLPEYPWGSPFPLEETGRFGVALFFVISGFIVATIALNPDTSSRLSPGEFAKRRFVRILPFMWLCAIGYNLLSGFGTGVFDWASWLRGMTLWPVGELKPNVLWSLRNELLFYAIFGLTILTAKRRPWILGLWLIAPLVLAIAVAIRPTLLTGLPVWAAELIGVVFGGNSTGANLQFGAGLLLGLARLKGKPWMQFKLPAGLLITLIASVASAALIEVAMFWGFGEPFRLVLWTVVASLVVWLGILVDDRKTPLNNFGLLLGNASYAIYLVHNAVLLVMMEIAKRFSEALPAPVFWVAFAVAAVAGGVFAHLVVEKPLLKFLSRRAHTPVPVMASDGKA